MDNEELYYHQKSDKVKWIVTAVALVLILALIAGLCVAFIPDWNGGAKETTFNVNLSGYKTLTADDVKDCKTLTHTTDDGDEELFKLLLVSYDEQTKECVFLMGVLPEDADESEKIEDDEAGFLCFVRAFDFEAEEVKLLSDYQSFKRLSLEKEYVVSVNFMGNTQGRWANVSTLFFGLVESGSDAALVDAPAAKLKFKAEGTFKPSDKVMNILTGKGGKA